MLKIINEPGNSNGIRLSPEPASLSSRSQTPNEKLGESSSAPSLSEESGFRTRPPILYDDPAFSSDSRHHPDHNGSPIDNQTQTWNVASDEPPPYEQVTISPPTSLRIDTSAQTTTSGESRPSSLFSPIEDTGIQDTDGGESTHDSVLLAYLQDEEDNDEQETNDTEDNIPMSLRPHMGLPLRQQSADYDLRGRSAAVTELQRSATLPPNLSSMNSEPAVQAEYERPRPTRRVNTTSPGRHAPNLDIIDEMDETVPLDQDRGRYQIQGRTSTPPVRVNVITRLEEQNAAPAQRVVITENASSIIPQALPFRINLKPGELLTRIPPPLGGQATSSSTQPYTSTPSVRPVSAMQPIYQEPRSFPQNRVASQIISSEIRRPEWSPEHLYEDQRIPHSQYIPTEPVNNPNPYANNTRGSTPTSSANSSRVDLRPTSLLPGMPQNNYGNYSQGIDERRHVVFADSQQPMKSALSRSATQPFYPSSSSASVYSESSSTSRGPLTAVERHRPRRIVMPAPLQQQHPISYKTGANINTSSTAMAFQSAAAVIPVHDPKRGNMLKKRATIQAGVSPHQKHSHLGVERSVSTKGFFSSLGSTFGKGISAGLDTKLPKPERKLSKLSKRKTLF